MKVILSKPIYTKSNGDHSFVVFSAYVESSEGTYLFAGMRLGFERILPPAANVRGRFHQHVWVDRAVAEAIYEAVISSSWQLPTLKPREEAIEDLLLKKSVLEIHGFKI